MGTFLTDLKIVKELGELKLKIEGLEMILKPLEDKRRELWEEQRLRCEARIKLANQGKGDFALYELTFAAHYRCGCGAGFAYPKNAGIHGSWICSDILRGKAVVGSKKGAKNHSGAMPFAFYEIKGENQPSARGATTRPENG